MIATATDRFLRAVFVTLCLAPIVGCGGHDDAAKSPDAEGDHLAFDAGNLSYDSGAVVVGRSEPKARIAANGDLTIGGTAVTVDATQRAQLAEYHATATAFRTHAKEVGLAGARLGTQIAADVIGSLAKGDTSHVEANAKEKAEGIKAAAFRLCEDLQSLRGTERKLAASLPQFEPYVFVEGKDVDDCMKDTRPAAQAAEAPAETPAEAAATAAANSAAAAAASAASAAPPAPAAPASPPAPAAR